MEEVDHVVDVRFVKAKSVYGPHQIRVAVKVVLLTRENCVDVRVAARAEQVMDSSAILVNAVPVQTVVDNGS